MAELVKRLTLGFGSGHDLRVVRSGSRLMQSPLVPLPLLPLPSARSLSLSLSLSEINKSFFFKFFLFIYDSHTERERKRGRGRSRLHAPGARCGIRSQVSRIVPWAKGRCQTAAPPRDPLLIFFRIHSKCVMIQ